MLATCHELGIREVYRVGGAQGVAALAYGVEGVPKVDKIVGPGNLFVALAKRHVYGEVDIDSIAGPSEVVVIADDSTRPDFTAADLLAQAEHAPGASILVTWSERLLEATARRAGAASRRPVARRAETIQSLRDFGCLILVRDEDEACRITDLIAPEHLHIAIDNAERAARQDSAMPARRSWATTAPWPWATTPPARRTCCPPAARPGGPAACRPTTFCAPAA